MNHLDRLEAESIFILREAVAEAENPAMLYSTGKDSSAMLHLARKAFFPSAPPFPLLHVDTRWKFRDMYSFRDRIARECGLDLLVHVNPEAIEKDINPFDHGSALHTEITKTAALKQALDKYRFDVVFGGARRDEEKSRAGLLPNLSGVGSSYEAPTAPQIVLDCSTLSVESAVAQLLRIVRES